VPQNNIAQALLTELGEAMMSVTLIMPGDEYPLSDPYDIRETLEHEVDLVIDGGYCGLEPTSVIDMTQSPWQILRRGLGDVADFDGA
jgi:tRNA A37 threonylcarbamoyladenosine synthetase subunit TsaC/SUA5/YrdC